MAIGIATPRSYGEDQVVQHGRLVIAAIVAQAGTQSACFLHRKANGRLLPGEQQAIARTYEVQSGIVWLRHINLAVGPITATCHSEGT